MLQNLMLKTFKYLLNDLSVGTVTYSTDARFSVLHPKQGVWNLHINRVRKEDEGVYECNLSHHPPESIFVTVDVIQTFVKILGKSEIYVDEGTALKLECEISQVTETPTYVFW